MESKHMPLLILTVILSVTIAHPHLGPDSLDCCDVTEGSQCFCNVEYDGDYDYDSYLYYGDCECNEISSLSVVLLNDDAESITFFDTNDEENVQCSFNHIHQGQEITCVATKGDRIFDESISFIIIRDGKTCKGYIETVCDDSIINSKSSECEELAVTGYSGHDGECDDGLEPCYCRGGFQQRYYIHDGGNDIISDISRNEKPNDDVVKKLQSGDGIIISPLFSQYFDDKDKKHGIISYSDSSGDSYSKSGSKSGSGSGSVSKSGSYSGSKSGSGSGSKSASYSKSGSTSKSGSNSVSKSGSKSGSYSKSGSNSGSKSESKSDSKSGSQSDSGDKHDTYIYGSDGRQDNGDGKSEPLLELIEPLISGPEQGSDNSEDDDKSPDDDLSHIDSDDSKDGVFIENESSDDDEINEAMSAPINMEPPSPIINIIEPDSKSSIYVTMSYYIILMIVFINTVTFGYYFCIRPLNKYCKDNNLVITYNEYFKDKTSSLDYNGYSKGNINTSSKDVIIPSSVDADNDTDVSPLSDATEDEQE